MTTKYFNDNKYGVIKKVKNREGLFKTPTGDIITNSERDYDGYSTTISQTKLRRKYKRLKFNYDVAMPILPEGLEFSIRVLPVDNVSQFRIDVIDTDTKRIIVTSNPRELPVSKEGFKAIVPEMVDEMYIPTFNPLEFLNVSN